jgi:hypothetical protein
MRARQGLKMADMLRELLEREFLAVAAKLMGETLGKLEADLVAPIDERR